MNDKKFTDIYISFVSNTGADAFVYLQDAIERFKSVLNEWHVTNYESCLQEFIDGQTGKGIPISSISFNPEEDPNVVLYLGHGYLDEGYQNN